MFILCSNLMPIMIYLINTHLIKNVFCNHKAEKKKNPPRNHPIFFLHFVKIHLSNYSSTW